MKRRYSPPPGRWGNGLLRQNVSPRWDKLRLCYFSRGTSQHLQPLLSHSEHTVEDSSLQNQEKHAKQVSPIECIPSFFIAGFWSGAAEPWKVQPVLTKWCLNICASAICLFIESFFSLFFFYSSWCRAACTTPLRPEWQLVWDRKVWTTVIFLCSIMV